MLLIMYYHVPDLTGPTNHNAFFVQCVSVCVCIMHVCVCMCEQTTLKDTMARYPEYKIRVLWCTRVTIICSPLMGKNFDQIKWHGITLPDAVSCHCPVWTSVCIHTILAGFAIQPFSCFHLRQQPLQYISLWTADLMVFTAEWVESSIILETHSHVAIIVVWEVQESEDARSNLQ